MHKLEILFLGQKDVKNFLDMQQVIPKIKKVFENHGRASVILSDPVKIVLPLEPSINGHFVGMPAFIDLKEKSVAGVKWIGTFPDNPKQHGLPTSSAILIINDTRTGVPVCFMEASLLTAIERVHQLPWGPRFLLRRIVIRSESLGLRFKDVISCWRWLKYSILMNARYLI